ncbi:MucR family transcriptional regulator [Blastococcus brunescens]|uniref:MucR family transcriptional regulator n=1 Tax=Blastococcus brunescens TaxID=1564165 RepID=A0ABZ1B586_9ACTN|nr:MucR family transcriptional regulator [Blastococcus sp. BMG 8361]WRL64549.1 MucR family transcriptional regulator [Blastococcus sp. BMG 8361]
MWHPVGELPARVYWRRRVVVLAVVLALLGGVGWLAFSLLSARDGGASASDGAEAVPEPALERVVPSLTAVATPDPPPVAETVAEPPVAAPDPVPGGPCTDDMITLEVRTPGSVPVGSKPTFELAVANVAAVPCVRALDKGLQEIVMLDSAGNRVWGSNDCFPEASSDPRTLAPGEVVTVPLVWGGLTSEPTCSAPRVNPPPGSYLLRARLDTKVSPDATLTLV